MSTDYGYSYIPVDKLDENPENIRTEFTDIKHLAMSIAAVGVLEPLKVRKNGDRYTVIDGNRRLRAIKSLNGAGPEGVDAEILTKDGEQSDVLTALVTGLQKATLSPLDQATGFAKALELGMKLTDLAKAVGYTTAFVKGRLSLTALPVAWRDRCIAESGLDNAIALASALAKFPEAAAELEIPEPATEALDIWDAAELKDAWPGASDVETAAAKADGRAQAQVILGKCAEAGVHANIIDDQTLNGIIPKPWIQLVTDMDEKRDWSHGCILVTATQLKALRRVEDYNVVIECGLGYENNKSVAKVAKREYLRTIDALPDDLRPATTETPAQAERATKNTEADKERKAEERATKKLRKARTDAVLNKRLTIAQRDDALWLAVDWMLERNEGKAEDICTLLGLTVPEAGGGNGRPTYHQNATARGVLEDHARISKVERDKVALAVVLHQQLTTWDAAEAVDAWLAEVVPEVEA